MKWRIDSNYSFLGDWGVIFIWLNNDGPLQAIGPWSEWETIERQLMDEGRLETEVAPCGTPVAILPQGIRIRLEPGSEHLFYDVLLFALEKMEGERAGGVHLYYKRWAWLAAHDILMGSYQIPMTGW